ncbi:acid phosphatase 1 [Magnolia sinica]|uniref:acid phosphatase 1 n=1 Tax=Magnolia sinica TaxID=86752 RepID=UPI00265AF1F8|nr:acid phosphatase 1 [Magnolia sinica]
MNLLLQSLFFLSLSSIVAFAHESHPLPRPLIVEYPEKAHADGGGDEEEARMRCTSWRIAVEANNLKPWKTIPPECAGYVKDYMMNRGYGFDLEMVAKEAVDYARSVELGDDGKDVWIFDVDETLLSNLPYYVDHGFGLEVFDGHQFDIWVGKAMAPVIESSLKLYNEVVALGFKVFLLTGRSELQRSVTVDNLRNAGFQNWDKLILRGDGDHRKPAILYKSERREEMAKEGYRILGNSGDQWSDLLGSFVSNRSFKLPNPMYYIA